MKTHIVIPLGVGSPGTPVQEYLESAVNSILNQTIKDYDLTVAADSNIPERCKQFLQDRQVEIKWFDTYSYFRRGGIWKKIFDTWKEKDTEFLAFLHADDMWDEHKLELQISTIKNQGLLGAWSETYIIDSTNEILSGDVSWKELSYQTLGTRTPAFAHSVIISRKAVLESGILDHEDKWAGNFEDIWALYVHKIKKVGKAHGSKFFWRSHEKSVSNTLHEYHDYVKAQRIETTYSFDETVKDLDSINMLDLYEQIKNQYI